MPSLQNLEKFKKELNGLGNEPEVLARRGERLEDVPPPQDEESELSAGLEALPSESEPNPAEETAPDLPPSARRAPPSVPSPAESAPPAPEAATGGLVDYARRPRGGSGLLRRATERSEASPLGLAEAGRPSAESAAGAAAFPAEERPEPPSEPAAEEDSSGLFLDDFLRSEGEVEESELTAIPTAAEQPSPPPADVEPGSDEELFFTVPSPEQLAGEEEAPPTSEAGAEEMPDSSELTAGLGAAPEVEEAAPPEAEVAFEGFGEETPELSGLGAEPGAEPEPAVEAGPAPGASTEPEQAEEELFAGLGDLGDLGAFEENPPAGEVEEAEPGAETEAYTEGPVDTGSELTAGGPPDEGADRRTASVDSEVAPPAEGAPDREVEEPSDQSFEMPEADFGEIDLGGADDTTGFGDELSSLGDLQLGDEFSPPEESAGRTGGGAQRPAVLGGTRAGGSAPSSEPPEEEPEVDEFGLGDISAQLGLGVEEEPSAEEALNPASAIGQEGGRSGARRPGAEEPFQLSDRDFRALRATLSSLPRNLRLAIEELIGERGLEGRQLRSLVDLLVSGASPREISAVAGRILGRRIAVPATYAKRTGLEFEVEKGTFAYRFRQNILPILRTFLFAGLAIALAIFLGYRFVYRPLHALTLYGLGYADLQRNEFIRANDYFDRGVVEWRLKNWYFRYAEGFVDKKQYAFAAAKYDALLRAYPGDRKGIFDYAHMESAILGNYPKAEELLNLILKVHMFDREALLAAGDNYLAWGSEDRNKYELARRDYAILLQKYGVNNEVLFRMLRFFIKTDNFREVERLEQRFQADKSIRVDPIAYAELGGYLIDKGRLGSVRDILMRALAVDRSLPEIHFNLARYFKATEDNAEEAKALQNTLYFLQRSGPLTRERLAIMIETYDLVGENLYRQKRYLDSEQAYVKGINLYESALDQDQVQPEAKFGRLYSDLGDLNYYESGNYANALRLYQKAEANRYRTPELKYKEGYIYYRNEDYAAALLSFYVAAGNFSTNPALLYATANTLFKRGDFFAAEGYYDNLLNTLEQRRSEITNFQPNENSQDRALLDNLMKVYNNLGVTMSQIGRRSADPAKSSQALVDLTKSSESFDQLTRDPSTMQRAQAINLSFINTKYVLFPIPGYQLQIYNDLPKDMTKMEF